MTAIGIAGNFIFHQKVPSILDDILEVLGNAFSASALFYLGLSMVGKVQSQVGMAMVVPVLLIFAKSLLLPLVTWEVVGWLQLNTNVSQSLRMVAYREKSGPADWRHYAQFVTLLVGVFASRCWTAALALALCLLHVRSLCFVLKSQVWLLFLGFG
nr:hypothetical protein BaRGS_009848 [Batillaria attramentaria]